MKAFWVGLPGAIQYQATPVLFCHSRIARLVSSMPLSPTMLAGLPYSRIRLSSARATRRLESEVSAISAGQQREGGSRSRGGPSRER